MSGLINAVAGVLRTPEEQAHRDRQIQMWEVLKTVGIVAIVAAAIFAILIPNAFTFILAGLTALGSYDLISVSSNMLEMTRDVTVSGIARLSKESLINQIAKNTLFTRSVINLMNPSYDEIVRGIDRIGT